MIPKKYLLLEAFVIWFAPGVNILRKGLRCLSSMNEQSGSLSMSVCGIIAIAVFIAFIFMFRGFVRRNTERIMGYENPKQPFYMVFDLKGWILLAFMIALGITLGHLPFIPTAFFASFYPGLGTALCIAGSLFLRPLVRKY